MSEIFMTIFSTHRATMNAAAQPKQLSRPLWASLAALLALLSSSSAALSEFRQAPNSRVSLDVSEAFAPSDLGRGFVDKQSGTTIVIVEGPPELLHSRDAKTVVENLKTPVPGVKAEINGGKLPNRKDEHVYVFAKLSKPGLSATKFMLMFSEKGLGVIIVVNVPQAAIGNGTYSKERIEKILATARVKD